MSLAFLAMLKGIVESTRVDLSNEKATQADLERRFMLRCDNVKREHRLGDLGIVDFLIGNSVVVEVKIKGSCRSIARQLDRYAQSDDVSAILLVSNVPVRLPSYMRGKPVAVASLGKGWL